MKWAMVWTIVGSTVLADLLQSYEMKRHSVAADDLRPGRLPAVLGGLAQRGLLLLAVFFMAISFFAFMKLLSLADLSFAVPVTAASVALETVLAKLVLREKVTPLRWAGALSVACGVALLAM
jgi:drug/metabolite transporter (DMT)-like permease